MFLANIFSKMSVRARIVVFGVIPVIGFLTNGMAFLTGDTAVENAFDTVHRNTEVADASRDLKAGLLTMRAATTDFVAHPSDAEAKNFGDGQAMAMKCLDRIEASLSAAQQDTIMPLRITVRDLKSSFESLVTEEKMLGFDETQGVTAELIAASNAVENIIQNELSWVAAVDSGNLTASLLTMRRYEIEYRLTRDPVAQRHFADEVKHFNAIFESVDGAPAMKEKLNTQVQAYSRGFAQWVASTDNIQPLLALISRDTASVLPEADRIIETAEFNASSAGTALAMSRVQTKRFIVWVGLAVVLIGLACSWRIGRSITSPLEDLGAAMKRLAGGDTMSALPATQSHDEIGAMARTVVVFRDNMIERERLAGLEGETGE